MALLDRQDRRQHLAVDADEPGGDARLLLGLGDHPGDGVAGEADLGREQRLVAARDADVVLARHVVGGEHGEDARRLPRAAAASMRTTRACACGACTGQACATCATSGHRSST